MSDTSKPPAGASSPAPAGSATPREELIRQLMDPNVPKSEREWCAAREIEEMLEFIREEVAIWDGDGDSGFPQYEDGKRILARYQRSPNAPASATGENQKGHNHE